MKKPSGAAPKRSTRRETQRAVIRVLTEGQITEPSYLSLLERSHRTVRFSIDTSFAGNDPLNLVREAKRQLKISNRRSKAQGPDFDEIWCVFDCDDHERLKPALVEAQQSGVRVALSNPCFELWLVLHVEEQQGFINGANVQRRARQLGLTDGKKLVHGSKDELLSGLVPAVTRAETLDRRHLADGSDPGSNPSSGMWRLVGRLA